MSIDQPADEMIRVVERAFFSSSTGWPQTLRKRYISFLINKNQLSRKELPKKAVDGPRDELLEKILGYDRNLGLFRRFQSLFERYGKKTIAVHRMPKISSNDRSTVQGSALVPFDVLPRDDAEVVGYSVRDNVVSVTIARTIRRPSIAHLKSTDFNEETWKEISNRALSSIPSSDRVIELNAKVSAPRRTITTLRFDFNNEIMEIASDLVREDERQGVLSSTEIRDNRREAISVFGNHVGLSHSGTSSMIATIETQKPIVKETIQKRLQGINEANLLVIAFERRFEVPNEDVAELSEEIAARLGKQVSSEIKSNGETYFDEHGTFVGFFNDYPKHKTENAHETNRLVREGRDMIYSRAYVLVRRDREPAEKTRKKGHLETSVLDLLSIDIDASTGEVRITNGEYSSFAQRLVLDRLVTEATK